VRGAAIRAAAAAADTPVPPPREPARAATATVSGARSCQGRVVQCTGRWRCVQRFGSHAFDHGCKASNAASALQDAGLAGHRRRRLRGGSPTPAALVPQHRTRPLAASALCACVCVSRARGPSRGASRGACCLFSPWPLTWAAPSRACSPTTPLITFKRAQPSTGN
jgi:hypothetical protein